MKMQNVIILVDVSESMGERRKMQGVNVALKACVKALKDYTDNLNQLVQVKFIEYGDFARASDWQIIDEDFKLKHFEAAYESTDFVSAFQCLRQELAGIQNASFEKPVILLLTDGDHMRSNDPEWDNLDEYLAFFKTDSLVQNTIRFAISIGEYVNREILTEFVNDPNIPILFARNAQDLTAFINWTLPALRGSTQFLALPPVSSGTKQF